MKRICELFMVMVATLTTSIAISISGCATIPEYSEGRLFSYVLSFIRETGADEKRSMSTKLVFTSLAGTTVGECNPVSNVIRIDPEYWFSTSTDLEKKALIYHEMIHCVTFFFHLDEKLDDDCPSSIMSPELPNDECLDSHAKEYLEDLKRIVNSQKM